MTDPNRPEDLMAVAEAAATNAYAPYSNYRVGAVAVDEDGRMFTGVNVENAAYGSTMCAEATAIGSAVAAGARRLTTVAVATLDATDVFPCGNCRQMMHEFGVDRVVVAQPGGGVREFDARDLLPHGFDASDLAGGDG